MEVVKDLTCPICLEFFSHPIILPCSHVMCRQPCAENVFEGNFIRCPVCRDNCYVSGGISSLPRVITIESIIEKIKADRKKRKGAQRRDNNSDDLSSEMIPDGWMFKTNLDELLSEIGTDRTSPDIFETRSDVMPNGGMSIAGHYTGQPAFACSSSTDRIPTSTTLPRLHSSEIGNSLFSNVVLGDSPRLRTPSDRTGRRSQHLLQSSHFNSISSCSGSPASISTPRDHSSSNCFAESYSPSQGNQISVGSSQERLSASPVFHRSQSSECHFLPQTSSHDTNISISQIRNHDRNNSILTTSANQVSERQRSLSKTTPTATTFADNNNSSLSNNNNNNNNNSPVLNAFGIHQITNPLSSGSTRVINDTGHSHQSSFANLKACSYSILDLQSEYLTLTSQIGLQPPREGRETEITSVNSNLNIQQTPNVEIETPGMADSRLDLGVPLKEYQTRKPNPTNEVTGASSSSGISLLGPTHLDASVSGNPDSRSVPKELMSRMNHCCSHIVSETGGNPNEFPDDDVVIANDIKLLLQNQLEKLCQSQSQLMQHMSAYRTHAEREQKLLENERQEINQEFDSLVAEIENKRSHFLLQLGNEEKQGSSNLDDVTVAMETLLESSQHLTQFVAQMLESKPELLLNTASNVFDRLSRAVQECESCLQESVYSLSDLDTSLFQIDTRVQRSVIADLDYLDLPSPPNIDTHRCVRNAHIVALMLTPPPLSDVINHYEVCYCSEEQKKLGIEERYYAKQSAEVDVHDVTNGRFPVILIENLCPSTHYYFCVCAVNRKGSSPYSDYVQCLTLGQQDCVVPVPTIMDNLCHATSTCVQLVCPSLVTVTAHQEVGHYLLQRREQGAFLWNGRQLLHNNEEFLVTKLRRQTRYFFIVMAYNKRGECQLSTPCTFDTT